jgi:TolA-binding protein
MQVMLRGIRVATICGTFVAGCLLAERSWAQAAPAPAANPPANAGSPTVPPTDAAGNKLTGPDGQPITAPAPTKSADGSPAAAPAKEPVKPQPRLFVSPDAAPPQTAPDSKPAADPNKKPASGAKSDPFVDDASPGKPAAPKNAKPQEVGTPPGDDTKPKTESPAATPKGPISQPLDTRMPEVEQLPGQAEFKAGQDLLTAGKYKEAIEQFRKSLKLAPDEAATHFSLGVCYRMLNRLDEAIDEFS